MKKRLVFMVLVLAGGLLLASQFPPRIDVMPLPASSARVRLDLPVRFAGEYRVEVSTPKMDNELTLREETFACSLLVSIEEGSRQVSSQNIQTIRTASEFGWGNIQTFVGGENFHLDRGSYDATITGGSGCPVATTRGASITIARFESEHILGGFLIWCLASVLIVSGIVGLMVSEFLRKPNKPIQSDAPEARA